MGWRAAPSSLEVSGTKTWSPETTGEPVMPTTGLACRAAERQISLPVWASKARTVRVRSPIIVSQPLGETSDFTIIGVVRETAFSTTQRTQPVAGSRA